MCQGYGFCVSAGRGFVYQRAGVCASGVGVLCIPTPNLITSLQNVGLHGFDICLPNSRAIWYTGTC